MAPSISKIAPVSPACKHRLFFFDNSRKNLTAVSHCASVGPVPSFNQSLMPKICSNLIGQAGGRNMLISGTSNGVKFS